MTDPLTPDDLAALRDYAKRYHESLYATEKNLAFNLLRLLDEVERLRKVVD